MLDHFEANRTTVGRARPAAIRSRIAHLRPELRSHGDQSHRNIFFSIRGLLSSRRKSSADIAKAIGSRRFKKILNGSEYAQSRCLTFS